MGKDTDSDNREGFRVLGLIPARGGSKSIPLKNMAILGGKPLYEWVLDAAIDTKFVTGIVISTDIPELLDTPFAVHRPAVLCTDDSPIIDTIKYHSEGYDAVALLQPTSPFVTPQVIDNCIQVLRTNPHANSVQTIAPIPHNYHAYNQRECDSGGFVRFEFNEQRQQMFNKQLKPEFFSFGNFVATRTSALDNGVFAEPSYSIFVDRFEATDIDTEEDLLNAEALWQVREKRESKSSKLKRSSNSNNWLSIEETTY